MTLEARGVTSGTLVVTLWYRPPEVLLGVSYASPVDLWSVGCIIAELYRLKPLFCGSSEGDQLNKIFQVIGKPSESEWPQSTTFVDYHYFEIKKKHDLKLLIPNLCENGYNLLMEMLQFNPDKRISAYEALNHIYFTEEPLSS